MCELHRGTPTEVKPIRCISPDQINGRDNPLTGNLNSIRHSDMTETRNKSNRLNRRDRLLPRRPYPLPHRPALFFFSYLATDWRGVSRVCLWKVRTFPATILEKKQ